MVAGLTLLLSAFTALGGWFARGKQRHVSTEDSALALYQDSLNVLERVQQMYREMVASRDRLQSQLVECIDARDTAIVERGRDRVKLTQLEADLIEERTARTKLEREVMRLIQTGGERSPTSAT